MKKLLPALLFAVLASVCYGQQNATITLAGEVKENTSDQDASVYFPKTDQNDKKCALVKVTPSQKLRSPLILEVGGLGVVAREEKPNGEVWFYIPAQVKNLTFKCAGYTCPAPIPVALQSGRVYRIALKATHPASTSASTTQPTTDDDSEHLTFKGIPITGTRTQFTTKLKSKGFNFNSTYSYWEGEFVGFKDCKVWVYTTDMYDLVYRVEVRLYEGNSTNCKEYFNTLANVLTRKYGAPHSKGESKIVYITQKGEVTLYINSYSYSYYLELEYKDYKTIEMSRNLLVEDAMSEL